jgi:hypothetical protein
MGSELFGTDIAGIIADTIGEGLLDVVVTRQAEGTRNPGSLTGGKPRTPTEFEGIKGFWEDFTGLPPPGIVLEIGDRKAVLIGDTIPAGGHPLKDDAITIEGETLYVGRLLSRDPAAAVYVYLCHDRAGADRV